jgi:hypothetical protein
MFEICRPNWRSEILEIGVQVLVPSWRFRHADNCRQMATESPHLLLSWVGSFICHGLCTLSPLTRDEGRQTTGRWRPFRLSLHPAQCDWASCQMPLVSGFVVSRTRAAGAPICFRHRAPRHLCGASLLGFDELFGRRTDGGTGGDGVLR